MACALFLATAVSAANLLPNGSFESTEPPPPNKERAQSGEPPPAESWPPRTWNVWCDWNASWSCPDDPATAHSGRRCLKYQVVQGVGRLRYGPMPVPDGSPWTVRLYARGKGTWKLGGYAVEPGRWTPLPATATFTLEDGWKPFEWTVTPGCRSWALELTTQGAGEYWLDDVEVSYPGLPDLHLPPDQPAGRDEHTLLYLPFEEALNEDAFFIKGRCELASGGRFGKCLRLGAEGYVACSATEGLDPRQGTIELWVKLLSPGNDGVFHGFVMIPGPEGMALCKDQYSHISFGFSSGWGTLSRIWADGYAHWWQPGVWRHIAACWDKDSMELFVDGKLIAWGHPRALSRMLGPELGIGGPDLEIDDLRVSDVVRYHVPVAAE
ncbi:MAG: hypothetical protein HYU66_19445 [Armatimonadetes bacterium]|nr:hypothetical protein [Armatimonadota bacterium]